MKPIDISYGLGTNNVITDKLQSIAKLSKTIDGDSTGISELITNINSRDDVVNYLSIVNKKFDRELDNLKDKKNFINFIVLFKSILSKACNYADEEIGNKVSEIKDKVKNFYLANYTNDESIGKLVDTLNNNMQTVICKSKNIINDSNGYSIIKIERIKAIPVTEGTVLDTTSAKIYSENNPNGTIIKGRATVEEEPINSIVTLTSTEDIDELIARLPYLTKYIEKSKTSINDSIYNQTKTIIEYLYSRFICNNTGLRTLVNELERIHVILSTATVIDDDYNDSLEDLKELVVSYIDKCSSKINDNEKTSHDFDSNIVIECGMGFLYLDPVIDKSLIESYTFDEDEFMQVFTEAMNSNDEDDYEKQMRKEQKARNRKVIMVKGKTLPLTNNVVNSAWKALVRAIESVSAGGIMSLAFNGVVGTITMILALVVGFCKDTTNPAKQRMSRAMDMKKEIEHIDDLIDEMQSSGDTKNVGKLQRIKMQLQKAFVKLGKEIYRNNDLLQGGPFNEN